MAFGIFLKHGDLFVELCNILFDDKRQLLWLLFSNILLCYFLSSTYSNLDWFVVEQSLSFRHYTVTILVSLPTLIPSCHPPLIYISSVSLVFLQCW